MKNYKEYFKDKKITVMGLGLLGRSIAYTQFLAECGAQLIVTDLKSRERLATSIKLLAKYPNIKFVLGEHRLSDFQGKDIIIKSAGVPLDSIYIKEAQKNKIPVKIDASLFAELAEDVTMVGVTGTRGKTMTTMLIYEILKSNEKLLKRKIYLGGNVRGGATLPLLNKVKSNDIVVLELDSWQLQGFGDANISPNISVFTTFMCDHMNYYKDDMNRYFEDKANIFKYQKKGDVLITLPKVKKLIDKEIKSLPEGNKSKVIVVKTKNVLDWDFVVPGLYQRDNLACAVEVAKQFQIPEVKIKKAVKAFKGVEGRLQYVKTVKGIKIYNDNNATTPEATIAGIEALSANQGLSESAKKNIVLICGGATKNLPLENLVKAINKNCKAVVMIGGTGTDELMSKKLKVESNKVDNLKDAVEKALSVAKRGDIVLFSSAFASFGMFNNEYERNDLFMKIIKKLK